MAREQDGLIVMPDPNDRAEGSRANAINWYPVNRELERQVLQFVCEWPDCFESFVTAGLSEDCFGTHDHRQVATIIFGLRARGAQPTWFLVRSEILARTWSWDDVGQFQGFTEGVPRPLAANIPFMVGELLAASAARHFYARLGRGESLDTVTTDYVATRTAARGDRVPPLLSLRDRLATPATPVAWRIEGWQPEGTRVLLAAQAKAGKTTLRNNLIRTLVDGSPWLGAYPARRLDGAVVVLDIEMSDRQIDGWLRTQQIQADDCVRVVALRGRASTFNILDSRVRAQWARQLNACGARYLVLDCVRPVLDAVGLNEHTDAGRFLEAFDALLLEAGVEEACVIHHMGHQHDRSRGDSRFRDWPDVEWRLVRADADPASRRFISAFGRDVDVSESALAFDPTTRHLTIEAGSRQTEKLAQPIEALMQVIDQSTRPLSGRELKNRLHGMGHSRDVIDAALKRGERTGQLVSFPGARNAKLYRRGASVSGVSGECPADTASECPAAYREPDTRTLTPTASPGLPSRTLTTEDHEHVAEY
jgi:hypothetical protein